MRFLARLLIAAALIAPHQALAFDPGKVPPVTLGIGSTGDVSNTSVTVNGTARLLQSWLPSLAPLASPTFTGTATVPKLSVTGSGSTGDVSAMSVTASGTTQPLQSWLPTLAPLASSSFTGTAKMPTLSVTGSDSTGDVSGMSVTAGANTRTLATRFPLMAPLASPVFSGTVSAPVVNLSTLFAGPDQRLQRCWAHQHPDRRRGRHARCAHDGQVGGRHLAEDLERVGARRQCHDVQPATSSAVPWQATKPRR